MNILDATLVSVDSSGHLTLLEVQRGGDMFHLLLIEACQYQSGTPLQLAFKETEVLLTSSDAVTTANIHRAAIAKIEQGKILSQITLDYNETKITSIVPTQAFNALGLGVHEEIFWMVSPGEISLLRDNHGI